MNCARSLESFTIGEIRKSSANAIPYAFVHPDRLFHETDLVYAPFGVSEWKDVSGKGGKAAAPRITLLLRPHDGEVLAKLDEMSLKALRQLAGTQKYHPVLQKKQAYDPQITIKLTPKTKYWDPSGESREAPEHWEQCDLRVKLLFTHMWFTDSECGWSIQASDIEVRPRPKAVSPFAPLG